MMFVATLCYTSGFSFLFTYVFFLFLVLFKATKVEPFLTLSGNYSFSYTKDHGNLIANVCGGSLGIKLYQSDV